MNNHKGCAIYFSHGGGPLPLLGDPSHRAMVGFMEKLSQNIKRPDAIVVISAHWEESVPTVLSNDKPGLFYDYYGFPEEAYKIEYPAKGSYDITEKILKTLNENNIAGKKDGKRGFDHGLFVPMKMIYPKADIPMTQISLIKGLDPSAHIDLGKALRSLMDENILIIGSGFSFHNMSRFTWGEEIEEDPKNDEFQSWLIDVCTGSHSYEERKKLLLEWEKAPSARYCHPREEHLLPLHVCFGASEKPAELIFDDYIIGKRAVAFRW